MKLKLVYDSTIPETDVRSDLLSIRDYLSKLENYGIQHAIIDIAGLTDEEVFSIYLEAITPSVMKKVGIRRVFGSKRQSAFLFGKQVPALLVYEEDIVIDVYPQIKRWERRSEKLEIEGFLEDLLKIAELSISERHLQEADQALADGMPRWAVLSCVFAVEAFVWRTLWGKPDIEIVGIDGKRHQYSSIDFVYQYARKSKEDFPNPEDFEKLQLLNMKLFEKLRNTDDFLLSRTVKLGVITESESILIRDLRTVRNFCSHFNPFEVTIRKYKEAILRLGVSMKLQDKELEKQVASAVLAKTKELLAVWKKRLDSIPKGTHAKTDRKENA